MWPPTGPHPIRRNHSSRLPTRFVIFDTEADRSEHAKGEQQTWLCGVTCLVDRSRPAKRKPSEEWGAHELPSDLWEWVDRRAARDGRTVVVAHNLAYDLRVSSAVTELHRLGWRHERTRFQGAATWSRWRDGKRSLVMVDLFSWIPKPLHEIAELFGLRKERLPELCDDLSAFLARCRRDVEITRAAWLDVMDWLRDADLGTWQMTGNGQAWAAWRHRFMDHVVVAHMDEEQHELEREGSHTGRCEVWRHGQQPKGRYVEWDFKGSYATIAAERPVPVRFLGREERLDRVAAPRWPDRIGYLARVELTTERPAFPARDGDRIVWPVGTFTTTLWGPELAMLAHEATSYRILEAWRYELRPALRSFASWALSVADGEADPAHPVARAVCHQWGRSLVGRFGMRYNRLRDYATADRDDFVGFEVFDDEAKMWRRGVHIGRAVQIETDLYSSPDACPAIMAWIMSEARSRIWKVMQLVGVEHVLYVDTDSVIVDEAGDRKLAREPSMGTVAGLRRKGAWSSLDLRAPRQIILGDELRAAGIPKRAKRNKDGSWQAQVWRGLGESLKHRETDRVVILDRTIKLKARDRRRRHLPDGATAPVSLSQPAPANP